MAPDHAAYRARADQLAAALRGQRGDAPLGLAKSSSNLFRHRSEGHKQRLPLAELREVLAIDRQGGAVDTEAMIDYEALTDATLAQGLMPAVVPQLKSITAGGAVAGVGIEATSFRQGLVHDTMREADVLLASGELITCTPDNAHCELFYALPNSYGTLGYLLRVRLATIPVRPFVQVEHRLFADALAFWDALAQATRSDADFVDAAVFARNSWVLNVARFVDQAPSLSDYGYERIYHRSLLERELDHLTVRDWLWRWDTDWFWCSRRFGAERPLVRRLLGRRRLNSRTWTKMMRWNARLGLSDRLTRWRGLHSESVVQDVDIPLDRAASFAEFLLSAIGILPIWICPIRAADPARPFTLYPLRAGVPYVNFGFWDTLETTLEHEPGHFNRLIERAVDEHGGIKSLYSDSFYGRDEFARIYAMDRYEALKARYDPQRRLLGLYDKCVLRA